MTMHENFHKSTISIVKHKRMKINKQNRKLLQLSCRILFQENHRSLCDSNISMLMDKDRKQNLQK